MVIPAHVTRSSIHATMETTTPTGPWTFKNRPVARCGNELLFPARHGQNERVTALGRKNHLYAGSDGGAARWAVVASLLTTAKLNDVEPFAYLKVVLERMSSGHPMSRLDELLPWNWTPFKL
jgi:hypothetical protein